MRKTLTWLTLLLYSTPMMAGSIHVAANESLHHALRMAREWRRTQDPRCQGGITISIEGRHYMQEPLLLRPEDSGTPSSPTIIRGGTLHGDRPQTHTQLWPKEGMERLLDFNATDRTITIATPPQAVLTATNIEMVVHQRWAIAILRVKDMKVRGRQTIVSFHEPESRLEFEHPWPQPVINGERGSSSYLLRTTEQRDGIERLVVVDGASNITFDGVTFENTCWNRPRHQGHVTLQGGFPLIDAYKLQMPGLPWDEGLENQAWVERPVSAVSIRNAADICFTHCRFQQLASTALDFECINGGTVSHCTFDHIGGTAILGGSFAESPREVHRPYDNLAQQCQHLLISHNAIHHATTEDWGAVAIGLGYVSHCTVANNTVSHVNYSGICIGWGWTPLYTGMTDNKIINNNVDDYARQLYDAGGIYTLSNQPKSVISGNTISQPYPAPYATNHRAFCIYLDARTDGFTIEGNTTEGRPIRRDEIGDNQPGQNLVFRP